MEFANRIECDWFLGCDEESERKAETVGGFFLCY